MKCQSYADAIVDSALAAPADLAQHLAGCADCRALAEAHAAALKLEGAALPERGPVRPASALPRLALLAALALVVIVGGPMAWRGRGVDAGPSTGAGQTELGADSDQGWGELVALHRETGGYARADAQTATTFNQLPQYFALDRLSSRVEALSQSSTVTSKESP